MNILARHYQGILVSMLDILRTISDIVLPPSQDTLLIRGLSETDFLNCYLLCQHDNFVSLSEYSNPYVKSAINANKFDNNTKASKLLGLLLKEYLKRCEEIDYVIIPTPLSRLRQKKRGYNQVTRVAEFAASNKVNESILRRPAETKPQTTLNKTERKQNVKNAFSVKEDAVKSLPELIILLDDVVKTGATMEAARASLAPHLNPHTKILCLALAH